MITHHVTSRGPESLRRLLHRALCDPGWTEYREFHLPDGSTIMIERVRHGDHDVLFCALLLDPEVALADADILYRLGLTRRQAEVARLLALRMSNAEIATQLGISPHTARRHTEFVLLRLGAKHRFEVRRFLAAQITRVCSPGRGTSPSSPEPLSRDVLNI